MDTSAASSGMNNPRGNLDPTSSLDGPQEIALIKLLIMLMIPAVLIIQE